MLESVVAWTTGKERQPVLANQASAGSDICLHGAPNQKMIVADPRVQMPRFPTGLRIVHNGCKSAR